MDEKDKEKIETAENIDQSYQKKQNKKQEND